MLKARDAVQKLPEYHPPLGDRIGLRLDFNENTVGCSPRVLSKLRSLTHEDLARYPEREPVERMVAEFFGVPAETVLLTNGVDEGIHIACETYLEPGDEVLIAPPTFAMYEIYARATGANVVAAQAGSDFAFPVDALLRAISPRTKLIAIANPNNPTGAVVSVSDLLRIAKAAPQAALLVDEAYTEFYGESMLANLATVPNLLICRTFSKAYGLAGLRCGVLFANAEQRRMLRRVAGPYNVNGVAIAVLPEALADREYIRTYVEQVQRGRAELERTMAELGMRYWPSKANFVLANYGRHAKAFVAAMRDRGILVRDRERDPGCAGCVRINLGSDEHNARLLKAFREVIAELGISAEVAAA